MLLPGRGLKDRLQVKQGCCLHAHGLLQQIRRCQHAPQFLLRHGLQLSQEGGLRAREAAQAALQRVTPRPRRHRAKALRLGASVPGQSLPGQKCIAGMTVLAHRWWQHYSTSECTARMSSARSKQWETQQAFSCTLAQPCAPGQQWHAVPNKDMFC